MVLSAEAEPWPSGGAKSIVESAEESGASLGAEDGPERAGSGEQGIPVDALLAARLTVGDHVGTALLALPAPVLAVAAGCAFHLLLGSVAPGERWDPFARQ
jgi:hypothetical protein